MEYLREHFDITVLYYNPNITNREEYHKRVEEEKRLIAEYNRQVDCGDYSGMNSSGKAHRIEIIDGDYEPEIFLEMAKGLENCPEGKERCFRCYELRLRKTAQVALKGGYDFFTTTLSISPLKNAEKLNEIGLKLASEYHIPYLVSDFKKKNGYLRSIELSERFNLYRQDYCGCSFSKAEREKQKKAMQSRIE